MFQFLFLWQLNDRLKNKTSFTTKAYVFLFFYYFPFFIYTHFLNIISSILRVSALIVSTALH